MKFGTLIDQALLYIIFNVGELRPTGSPWGTEIHKWVKFFATLFSDIVLAECDEIWHDDGHWSIAGLEQFW